MFAFDEHLALDPVGDLRWRGDISDAYNVGDAPNGGYLMALGAAAISRHLRHPHPLTVTAHYLRRPVNGEVEIPVEVIREGRTLSNATASLVQEGREVVRLMATFADLAAAEGPTHLQIGPPELPPPDELPTSHRVEGLPEVAQHFDHRLTPMSMGFALGVKTERAEIEGYTRFPDGRPVDPVALLLLADALPPPVLNVVDTGWVPTVELTVHVRGIPAPGWLSFRFRTNAMLQGRLEEDGELWDSEGRLVAMSRQIALVRPPRRS